MNPLLTAFIVVTIASSTASARVIRHAKSGQYPRYGYKYWVNDPLTRDIKQHWEARDGDLVKGSYSLVEPDGKLRVVDYWADDAHGFNADVKRDGKLVSQSPAPPTPVVEAKITASSPKTLADPIATPLIKDALTPLAAPVNYGFGAGKGAPGQLYANVDSGSHRWDPNTKSYGGWVPLRPKKTHATIFTKKYIDGKLHEWAIGPIALSGRTLVFKVKH